METLDVTKVSNINFDKTENFQDKRHAILIRDNQKRETILRN